MILGPAWERAYFEPGLHEVNLSFFDVEHLVDLSHKVSEVLDDEGLSPFGLGVIGHLHAHHYYYDIFITNTYTIKDMTISNKSQFFGTIKSQI